MKKIVIAYDLGTSSVKATLVDLEHGVLASLNRSYPLHTDGTGKAEQDAEDWWKAFCDATTALLTGREANEICAVCVSGQMMVCLPTEKGRPLTPAMIWADRRAEKQSARLGTSLSREKYYHLVGMRPTCNYSLPKWMRFREEQPALYDRTDCFLSAKDYINYRLTGIAATDEEDAAFTQAAELKSGKWSHTLLQMAEIDVEKLPPVLKCGTILGEVTDRAAAECGLKAGTAVVLGTGDGGAATLGSGTFRTGDSYISLGTSSWVCTVTNQPELDPEMSVSKIRYLDGFRDSGTMQSGGYSFSWLHQILGLSYDRMNEMALGVGPGAGGLLFFPNLMGERAPFWDPDLRGSFVGIDSSMHAGHFCRAVPEGVAMQLDLIHRIILRANPGLQVQKITLVGGGADSLLWRQVIADVMGLPIVTTDMSSHAGALGIAVIAGKACGLLRGLDEVMRYHQNIQVTEPEPAAHRKYEELREIFLEARHSLINVDHKLSEWTKKEG